MSQIESAAGLRQASPNMSVDGVAEIYHSAFREHLDIVNRTEQALAGAFASLIEAAERALHGGGKIILFGNGGSAADAQHIAAELVVRYRKERPALAAIALTCDTSILTATANDYHYGQIFSRQIEAIGRAGDLAIGISTSGNSPNVLLGLEAARARNLTTAGFTGRDGGKMRDLCDSLLVVPSDTTARIQEMHILLGHLMCEAIDRVY